MGSSPHHFPENRSKHPRYEISLESARKINGVSDEEILPLQNGISVREWHGENNLQRYAIAHSGKPRKYYLVPVTHDHEGKTFVLLNQKNTYSSGVQSKTRSRLRTLLPALGIAAFLSLDTYLAYKFLKKDTSTDAQSKNIPTAQVQAPVIQKTPVQISTVSEIIKKNHISLDDFILNNPRIPLPGSHALESVLGQKVTLLSDVNVSAAPALDIWNPLSHLLWTGKTLEDLVHHPLLQKNMDQYHTMLESMISFECAQKDGNIPKDLIGWSDVHKGEQYAGINMNAAKNSGNTEKLQHAQEIASCFAQWDQKKLRDLVKAYYLLYYFPVVQSQNPSIGAFLLDTSMNRGADSIQPICKMVINSMTHRKYPYSKKIEKALDKEWKTYERHTWDTTWTEEHQKVWDILCTRFPYQVIDHLRDARRTYEDGTYGPRISIRTALENRWDKAQKAAEEMFLPATYRTISYHDGVSMIKKSLTEKIPTHDSTGKPIIYRVQRIQNPTKKQMKIEEIYKHTLAQPRPKKEMVLFHGTVSGILGVADERTRDLWWFNALYESSAAAYVITSKGLIFEFFDPTKWYGSANATRIAESTGIPKEDFNFNDACIGVELCLRGYKGGPFAETVAAKYGVEAPSASQKKAARELWLFLKEKLGIKHIGTSADPVRDHTKCYDNNGKILMGPEYLVPDAHCDDFPPHDREEMGIESPEDMAKIFWSKGKLSALFEFDIPAKKKLTSQ